MTTPALLKKLEAAVRNAEGTSFFGTIEVEFKAGRPIYLRTETSDKLDGDPHHARETYHR